MLTPSASPSAYSSLVENILFIYISDEYNWKCRKPMSRNIMMAIVVVHIVKLKVNAVVDDCHSGVGTGLYTGL